MFFCMEYRGYWIGSFNCVFLYNLTRCPFRNSSPTYRGEWLLSDSELNYKAEAERKNKALEIAKIRAVINVMSHSEVQAAICILKALKGKSDGLLVASKIADNKRFTRSLIVNALRKLQSAGLIESKSLGMKGTFIKILSPALFEEFRKKIWFFEMLKVAFKLLYVMWLGSWKYLYVDKKITKEESPCPI